MRRLLLARIFCFFVFIPLFGCNNHRPIQQAIQTESKNEANVRVESSTSLNLLNDISSAEILNQSQRHPLFSEALDFCAKYFGSLQPEFSKFKVARFINVGFFTYLSGEPDNNNSMFVVRLDLFSQSDPDLGKDHESSEVSNCKYKCACSYVFQKNDSWSLVEVNCW